MTDQITPTEQDMLILVDLQNDFCPGGALPVDHGDAVIEPINRLGRRFRHVVMTQDWHPADHFSFASAHPGRSPFDSVAAPYGEQTLWPDHCVQASAGSDFHPRLRVPHCEMIIRKGFRRDIDSYSTFYENDRTTPTGLVGYLRERGFRRVFLAGLATDYCVFYSALDARREGFETVVITDACRAIQSGAALDAVFADMRRAGVALLTETDVAPPLLRS